MNKEYFPFTNTRKKIETVYVYVAGINYKPNATLQEMKKEVYYFLKSEKTTLSEAYDEILMLAP